MRPPSNFVDLDAQQTAALLVEMRACREARDWSTGKTLAECWEQAERGDWLEWLLERTFPLTAPARAEYERVTATARAEYQRVAATARAEYERLTAPALRKIVGNPFRGAA